jgi:probable phosphoglycerate mutase
MTVTRVIVMRHGQAESNVPQVWTSSPIGYPLTAVGHEQARLAGSALLGRDVVAVWSSTLVRAKQTAAEVGAVLGLVPRTLAGLQEIHVGVHEGGSNGEVSPIAEEVFTRWWRDQDLSHGFDGGETGLEITGRMSTALDHVIDENPGETSVVVSHGGAMIVGLAALCSNIDGEFAWHHILDNTSTVEIVQERGGWRCVSWMGVTFD